MNIPIQSFTTQQANNHGASLTIYLWIIYRGVVELDFQQAKLSAIKLRSKHRSTASLKEQLERKLLLYAGKQGGSLLRWIGSHSLDRPVANIKIHQSNLVLSCGGL